MNKFEIMGEPKKKFFVDGSGIVPVSSVSDLADLIKRSGSNVINVNSLGTMRSFTETSAFLSLNSHSLHFTPRGATKIKTSNTEIIDQLSSFRNNLPVFVTNNNTFNARSLKISECKMVSHGRIYRKDETVKVMLYVIDDERLNFN